MKNGVTSERWVMHSEMGRLEKNISNFYGIIIYRIIYKGNYMWEKSKLKWNNILLGVISKHLPVRVL